jgi:hypothetical protein
MSVCRAHYPAVLPVCARAEVVLASSCSRGTRRIQVSRGHVHAVFVALQVCRDMLCCNGPRQTLTVSVVLQIMAPGKLSISCVAIGAKKRRATGNFIRQLIHVLVAGC